MPNKKTVFKTKWFSIESEEYADVSALGGKPIYRMNIPNSVVILALTKKREIIFVRQFRPVANKFFLELPAGGIEPRETPKEAAARELFEETGYVCQHLSYVGKSMVVPDRINTKIFVFFGRNAEKKQTMPSEDGIEIVLTPITKLRDLTENKEFQHIGNLGIISLIKFKLAPPELEKI